MADPDEERRRTARRHLSKWAKIMCQIVGLERVAEELMGRRSWNYQDMMVGQESKGGEPVCTTPLRQVPITSSGGDTRSGSSSPMAGGWYLRPGSPEPQPLDLSAKPPKPPASPPPLNKHIFKAKPRLSAVGGRRSYTEDELQAALRDIQSGKLGTRRAAVIYGIPRSTLRNKVYKLTQESRDFAGSEDRPDPDPDDDDDDDDRDLSGAEEERETERVLMRPIFSIEDVMRLTRDVTWPCLTQLLGGGASTSAEDPLRVPSFRTPVRNGGSPPPPGQLPGPLKSDQPLDFRREPVIRNHNNNHLEEKKLSPGGTKQQQHQQQQQQQQGGKGTRPKRGKYRNYDRDSLVEAVRAVQRGEMSVHRAGSYYGVPHSTLEYKVKERHLMRPRKREPKPQPEEKRKEDEKRPAPAPAVRPARVTPPLPSNGLKMPPLFDPALAYRPPFPFWQAPFPPLPLDYAARPELFSGQAGSAGHPLNTATREIAESLLESSGENGSFLDGIIRSSLASGLPGGREAAGKVLLEQLCRGGSIIDKPSSSGTPPPPPPSATSPHTRTPSTSPNC